MLLLLAATATEVESSSCPWARDAAFTELSAVCACEQGSQTRQAVSMRCHRANFTLLVSALSLHGQNSVFELLHVNDSAISILPDFAFRNLKVIGLRLNNAGLETVARNAFRGLENTLQTLDLSGNSLPQVPVSALRQLRLVSALDLSANALSVVPDDAFVTLRLKTLKLAHNNLTLFGHALRGLETSLKNLDLKGCRLRRLPEATATLAGLAFLDLAQNNIRELAPADFAGFNSLSALNLERNIVQKLHPRVFEGVEDTLSSLSLLNNLLTEYPTGAINSLKELRVSDQYIYSLHIQLHTTFISYARTEIVDL